jgi:transmembrane sensor
MPEFMERLVVARDYVSPQWTAEREVRVRVSLEGRRRSRARRRGMLAVAALSIVTAVAVVFALRSPLVERSAASAPPDAPKLSATSSLFQLPDGSSVFARSSGARVQPVEVTASAVTLKLESGAARFSVVPDASRPFRVLARDVTVTVLGTVFTVSIETNGVRVSVENGRVHVDSSATSRELSPGESALFTDALAAPAQEPASAVTRAAPPVPLPAPGPSWRSLARDGDYSAALTRLTNEGPSAVRDAPEDLLLAADVARLGGQPARAVASLERVVLKHSGDSRAPLAAFTLGRTLLDQLGRPREAANAFASARKLAPSGALAQDALAREVESWSRAGETEKARARAEEYLKLYPSGRRAASVRRLGGLEQ